MRLHTLTRKHCSRICTACLETVHASISVAIISCRWGGGGGSQNEQVWTGLQWSPPDGISGGSTGLMSRGGGAPSDLSNEAFDVTYFSPPRCEQTNACENITFAQAYLRAVKYVNKPMTLDWFEISRPSSFDWISTASNRPFFIVMVNLYRNSPLTAFWCRKLANEYVLSR